MFISPAYTAPRIRITQCERLYPVRVRAQSRHLGPLNCIVLYCILLYSTLIYSTLPSDSIASSSPPTCPTVLLVSYPILCSQAIHPSCSVSHRYFDSSFYGFAVHDVECSFHTVTLRVYPFRSNPLSKSIPALLPHHQLTLRSAVTPHLSLVGKP